MMWRIGKEWFNNVTSSKHKKRETCKDKQLRRLRESTVIIRREQRLKEFQQTQRVFLLQLITQLPPDSTTADEIINTEQLRHDWLNMQQVHAIMFQERQELLDVVHKALIEQAREPIYRGHDKQLQTFHQLYQEQVYELIQGVIAAKQNLLQELQRHRLEELPADRQVHLNHQDRLPPHLVLLPSHQQPTTTVMMMSTLSPATQFSSPPLPLSPPPPLPPPQQQRLMHASQISGQPRQHHFHSQQHQLVRPLSPPPPYDAPAPATVRNDLRTRPPLHQQQQQQDQQQHIPKPAGVSWHSIRSLPVSRLDGRQLEYLPDDARKCCICLEDFATGDTVKRLPCLHVFHSACVDIWLQTNGSCPFCKHRADATDGS